MARGLFPGKVKDSSAIEKRANTVGVEQTTLSEGKLIHKGKGVDIRGNRRPYKMQDKQCKPAKPYERNQENGTNSLHIS